jgi:RNA polymerase sigma-70 factor (ECF subfamily)
MDEPFTAIDEASLAGADDATIVGYALRRNEAAARELVRRFERPVFNLILRMVRDRSSAEDLTQDALLKVFRNLHTFDPALRLGAWILRIAHNTAIDHLRRARHDLLPLDYRDEEAGEPVSARLPADTPTPEQIANQASLATALDAALDRLRPEYRAMLILRFQEDLDYSDIAQVTGRPLGTVKTFIRRGRQALARELAAAGWEWPATTAETRGGGRP